VKLVFKYTIKLGIIRKLTVHPGQAHFVKKLYNEEGLLILNNM